MLKILLFSVAPVRIGVNFYWIAEMYLRWDTYGE
jgi:hypothetical protein